MYFVCNSKEYILAYSRQKWILININLSSYRVINIYKGEINYFVGIFWDAESSGVCDLRRGIVWMQFPHLQNIRCEWIVWWLFRWLDRCMVSRGRCNYLGCCYYNYDYSRCCYYYSSGDWAYYLSHGWENSHSVTSIPSWFCKVITKSFINYYFSHPLANNSRILTS